MRNLVLSILLIAVALPRLYAEDKIDINTATVEQLISLPGIGEVKAQAIIAYRTEHGPFKSIDELLNVKGIGPKILEKIRPFIICNQPQKPKSVSSLQKKRTTWGYIKSGK